MTNFKAQNRLRPKLVAKYSHSILIYSAEFQEKNPNQNKNNPEFFSKKVGDKLMKILTVEEMQDQN